MNERYVEHTRYEYAVELGGEILPAVTRESAEEFAAFRRSIGDEARAIGRRVTFDAWLPAPEGVAS